MSNTRITLWVSGCIFVASSSTPLRYTAGTKTSDLSIYVIYRAHKVHRCWVSMWKKYSSSFDIWNFPEFSPSLRTLCAIIMVRRHGSSEWKVSESDEKMTKLFTTALGFATHHPASLVLPFFLRWLMASRLPLTFKELPARCMFDAISLSVLSFQQDVMSWVERRRSLSKQMKSRWRRCDVCCWWYSILISYP